MLDVFQTSNKRINDSVEGFGNSSTPFNFDNIDEPDSLAEGKSAIVVFIMLRFSLSGKMIPLKMAPIVIELELVGNPGDCLNTGNTSGVQNSTSWKITEPQIKCDIITLDSELQNSYASHMLSGKHCQSISAVTQLTYKQQLAMTTHYPVHVLSLVLSRCLLLCSMVMDLTQATRSLTISIIQ